MNGLLIWRKTVNTVMLGLTGLCTLVTVSILFFILGYLVWNGARALNWDFFTQLPKPVGEVGEAWRMPWWALPSCSGWRF